MSGFDADWLRLREPLDAAARDEALAERFTAVLQARRARPADRLRIVDLAAGAGANLRALAPRLGGEQHWTLVDLDPALLAAQPVAIARWAGERRWACLPEDDGVTVRSGTATWQVRGRALDLAASLETLDAGAFDAVVTTAFLDLVSARWLERFAAWLAAARRPLLATLSVDGRRDWHPPLPGDASVDRAFRLHQGGDKGFGASLGIGAVAHLTACLSALGFEVSTARSDWCIDASRRPLLERLAAEAAQAACEAEPAQRAVFEAWAAARAAQARNGRLALEVGHLDLLALPPA
ncbi:MAG: class I SAM-dependent methyltransferase [Burkholderiales bacterium]|nr:class I SAM-dependent methyltransferase [Burkholderiales bacterium]